MPKWDFLFTDLISYNMSTMMSKWRVQRNYRVDIIIHLLKHVSAAPLSILSACGILRGTVQSAALYLVHSCFVFLPRSAKPGAYSPSAAITGGGTVLFAVPCQPSESKTRLRLSLQLPWDLCAPHQVIHSCMLDTGCRSRDIFCKKRLLLFHQKLSELPLSSIHSFSIRSKSHM